MSDLTQTTPSLNSDESIPNKLDLDCIHVIATYDEAEDCCYWQMMMKLHDDSSDEVKSRHLFTRIKDLIVLPYSMLATVGSFGRSLVGKGDGDLHGFLLTYGARIKKLVVNVFEESYFEDKRIGPAMQLWLDMLAELAPNLQHVHFDQKPLEQWESPSGRRWTHYWKHGINDPPIPSPKGTLFSNLKVLELPNDVLPWVVDQMVRVAPNLEKLVRF